MLVVLVAQENNKGATKMENNIDIGKLASFKDGNVIPEWQVRFKEEYYDLKSRQAKLHKMLVKYDAGTLDFKPTCPVELLRQQEITMNEYMRILEIRAQMEGVVLD